MQHSFVMGKVHMVSVQTDLSVTENHDSVSGVKVLPSHLKKEPHDRVGVLVS